MPITHISKFPKDWAKGKHMNDPEKLRIELWKINHRYYEKNKDAILAQQKEYRKRKKQLLLAKSVKAV